MGYGKNTSNREYSNVGFGKLRRKCEAGDLGAIEREVEGKKLYAIEHPNLTGYITGLKLDTEGDYGNRWIVLMDDGEKKYGVQVKEDSRYGTDLLKIIPNIKNGIEYTIDP